MTTKWNKLLHHASLLMSIMKHFTISWALLCPQNGFVIISCVHFTGYSLILDQKIVTACRQKSQDAQIKAWYNPEFNSWGKSKAWEALYHGRSQTFAVQRHVVWCSLLRDFFWWSDSILLAYSEGGPMSFLLVWSGHRAYSCHCIKPCTLRHVRWRRSYSSAC